MSTHAEHESRITALESAAFRTTGDVAEVKAGLDAIEAKVDEAARLADTRHTAVTTMLQEVLDRLPPRPQE
jgi:hypothetical protein